MRLAEQMAFTNVGGFMSDDLYADLRAHFDKAQIYELGMSAAALIGCAKFLFVFDLAERAESCPVHRPPAT